MKWKKYTIHTTTEAEDLVSMMLTELGVEGVQIEDNVPLSDADTKGMFIDILPELAPDDGTSRLSFFLHLEDEETAGSPAAGSEGEAASTASENNNSASATAGTTASATVGTTAGAGAGTPASDDSEDLSYTIQDRIWSETEIEELLTGIRAQLEEMRSYTDIGEGRIEEGITEDTDWRDNWKQFFKPIRTGNFLIKPTWEEVPEELKADVESGALTMIAIDPGTAFGTGSHETTQLCLKSVEKFVKPGDTVLDIGTGSGILGIAALKCGAEIVAATELDEQCEPSIRDNISFNGITEEQFRLFIGNIIGDEATIGKVQGVREKYDVVIANILAPVICMLAGAGVVDAFAKPGSIFITSGIIDEKLEDVKAAFAANASWEVVDILTQGEWCSVVAKRV